MKAKSFFRKSFTIVVIFLSFVFAKCISYNPNLSFNLKEKDEINRLIEKGKADILFVASWNVENLFDIYDDPMKNDDDFTPEGTYNWTYERYEKKLASLARVIRDMNDGNAPDLLGMQEVENDMVLSDLTKNFFKDKNYGISWINGPDIRSIDCALIFNLDKFDFLSNIGDTVVLRYSDVDTAEGDKLNTRLILTTKLLFLPTQDTFYAIVNHWPSRRGGQQESEINRIAAAQTLKKRVQKIFKETYSPKIIIMGDFNDEPTNVSIQRYLGVLPLREFKEDDKEARYKLYNLAYDKHIAGEGTLQHQGKWNLIDQIIVNGALIYKQNSKLMYYYDSFDIFKPKYFVTQKGKYAGSPFPTYRSGRYLGGYSDHFPVYAKFVFFLTL